MYSKYGCVPFGDVNRVTRDPAIFGDLVGTWYGASAGDLVGTWQGDLVGTWQGDLV